MARKKDIVADYGARLIAQLLQEREQSYQRVLSDEAIACMKRYKQCQAHLSASMHDDTIAALVIPVIREVIDHHLAPHIGYQNLSASMMHWILGATLEARHNERPIRAEDLYKYGEDLAYFDSVKKSDAFKRDTTTSNDLFSYGSWHALSDVLRPYRTRHARKQEARRARHMDLSTRNQIMHETTVVYDGPEGRIVAPHTARSSQHWGNQTRWCISGKNAYADFPAHYRTSLILILIPQGSNRKYALYDNTVCDDEDKKLRELTADAKGLFDAAFIHHKGTPRAEMLIRAQPVDEEYDEATNRKEDLLARAMYDQLDEIEQSRLDEFIDTVRANSAVTLQELRRNITDIEYYLGDSRFMRAAVARNGWLLKFASTSMQEADRQLVRTAISQKGLALKHASGSLQGDRDIVMTAVRQNGHALRYASSELKNESQIVWTAFWHTEECINYVSDTLKADPAFIRLLVARDGKHLRHASNALKNEPDIAKTAVANNRIAFHYIGDSLWADRDTVKTVLAKDGRALEYVSDDLKNNRDIVTIAVTQNGWALKFASDALKSDHEIVKMAVTQNGLALEYAGDACRYSPGFLYDIFRTIPHAKPEIIEKLTSHNCKQAIFQGLVDGGHVEKARDIMRFFPDCCGDTARLYPENPLAPESEVSGDHTPQYKGEADFQATASRDSRDIYEMFNLYDMIEAEDHADHAFSADRDGPDDRAEDASEVEDAPEKPDIFKMAKHNPDNTSCDGPDDRAEDVSEVEDVPEKPDIFKMAKHKPDNISIIDDYDNNDTDPAADTDHDQSGAEYSSLPPGAQPDDLTIYADFVFDCKPVATDTWFKRRLAQFIENDSDSLVNVQLVTQAEKEAGKDRDYDAHALVWLGWQYILDSDSCYLAWDELYGAAADDKLRYGLELLERAAAANHVGAYCDLANFYAGAYKSILPHSIMRKVRAEQYFHKAATLEEQPEYTNKYYYGYADFRLAMIYSMKDRLAHERDKACHHIDEAVRKGYRDALWMKACWLHEGYIYPKDDEQALESLYKGREMLIQSQAADEEGLALYDNRIAIIEDAEHLNICGNVTSYLAGQGFAYDFHKFPAKTDFQRELFYYFKQKDDEEQEHEVSFNLLVELAEEEAEKDEVEDAHALFWLGWIYIANSTFGNAVSDDKLVYALQLLDKAASAKHIGALCSLGDIYAGCYRYLLPLDTVKVLRAFQYYQTASEANDEADCILCPLYNGYADLELAFLYARAESAYQDFSKAVTHMNKAAQKGEWAGLYYKACWLYEGEIYTKDDAKALELLHQARRRVREPSDDDERQKLELCDDLIEAIEDNRLMYD